MLWNNALLSVAILHTYALLVHTFGAGEGRIAGPLQRTARSIEDLVADQETKCVKKITCCGIPGLPGQSGSPGVPGRPGEKGDRGKRGKSAARQAKNSEISLPVIFFARMDIELGPLGDDDNLVVFRTSVINQGGCYNTRTGKFTVMTSGVYEFVVNFHTGKGSPKMIDGYIMKETGGRRDSGHYAQPFSTRSTAPVSSSYIDSFEKGDVVYVSLDKGSSLSAHYSTFSGKLLWRSSSGETAQQAQMELATKTEFIW